MFKCPYCHQIGGENLPVTALRHMEGKGIRRVILRLLIEAYPSGLNKRTIEDQVYGNTPSGGPDFASGVISNNITALRDDMRKFGWTIPNYARAGHIYKLAPLVSEDRKRAA